MEERRLCFCKALTAWFLKTDISGSSSLWSFLSLNFLSFFKVLKFSFTCNQTDAIFTAFAHWGDPAAVVCAFELKWAVLLAVQEADVCSSKYCSLAVVTDQWDAVWQCLRFLGQRLILWCVTVTGWTWWALSSTNSSQSFHFIANSHAVNWWGEKKDQAAFVKTKRSCLTAKMSWLWFCFC